MLVPQRKNELSTNKMLYTVYRYIVFVLQHVNAFTDAYSSVVKLGVVVFEYGTHNLLSLPDGPVSLCFSLERSLSESESHLGRVTLRGTPFLRPDQRWSAMRSFCCRVPLLTGGDRG